MPLAKGSSRETVKSNIAQLREEGRPETQAVAAALTEARKSKGGKRKYRKRTQRRMARKTRRSARR